MSCALFEDVTAMWQGLHVYVAVCVRACVRACVRVCVCCVVRACVRACVCVCVLCASGYVHAVHIYLALFVTYFSAFSTVTIIAILSADSYLLLDYIKTENRSSPVPNVGQNTTLHASPGAWSLSPSFILLPGM